jgi:hypothetical protein
MDSEIEASEQRASQVLSFEKAKINYSTLLCCISL